MTYVEGSAVKKVVTRLAVCLIVTLDATSCGKSYSRKMLMFCGGGHTGIGH